MAKGQRRSNRETRKPKQPKAAAPVATRSFLETAKQALTKPFGSPKRTGR